ncbi:hypothetical protein T4A_12762 [Trichinella pseudospiralis]|uniref:Uncharacterized protein n=1 Tax=Trichinella pseudospiralis TaxID=6337 RepID=A0A0V1EIA1_TRIPS|nr:hypothetical protein T4A_12762 [Trichinella pseudospiralis]
MDYIEFDMLNTFRHLYKPKNMSICGKYVSGKYSSGGLASGNAPRAHPKGTKILHMQILA